MSNSWNDANKPGDKRKNLNWDLLPPKPERRTMAFTIFANDNANNAIVGSARLQNEWNNLSDMNKRRYEDVAGEQYQREIAEWKKKKSDLKRPPGAYVLFVMDLWAEEKAKGKRLPLGQMSQKARLSWNRATQRKKETYKARAREMLAQYNAYYEGFRAGKADR